MDFIICMANKNILIHCFYPGIYNLCRPYWAKANAIPDIEISINEEMIRTEAEHLRHMDGGPVYSIKSVEKLLAHKLITEALLSFDTLLMHGAAVALNGEAYLFIAKSGTGKTTHIQNWLDSIGGVYVVNGDKPFIIVGKDGDIPLVCGSPWAGKENLHTNTSIPLKSIVLLERAKENYMERVSFIQALPTLLEQVYRPDDEDKMRKTLSLMQRLSQTMSFWRFKCNNFKDDSFEVAYSALVRKQK